MNDYLKDFKGSTFNQRTIERTFKYLIEQKRKMLGYIPNIPPTALVIVHEHSEILSIGGSIPSDLILNNFGTWLAGFGRTPAAQDKSVTMIDNTNTSRTLYVYSALTGAFNNSQAYSPGTQIKIGSSATAPARGDYDVGTAFTSAPESGLFDTGTGSYAAEQGSITGAGSITAGGSGTIRESGLYGAWQAGLAIRNFMLFHDAISPATSFVAGNSITITYTITL